MTKSSELKSSYLSLEIPLPPETMLKYSCQVGWIKLNVVHIKGGEGEFYATACNLNLVY